MDVNQVRFGNYSIGNPRANAQKKEAKKEEAVLQQTPQNQESKNPDEVLNALNITGMQNAAQINLSNASEIPDVSKYLSDERIADIEAMMAEFESGVDGAKQVISGEFPGMFSEAQTNALAAAAFARE